MSQKISKLGRIPNRSLTEIKICRTCSAENDELKEANNVKDDLITHQYLTPIDTCVKGHPLTTVKIIDRTIKEL